MSTHLKAAHSSASDEWSTPWAIVDQLADEFGAFDLDPAATPANHKASLFYTEARDGLSQPWTAARAWLNGPKSLSAQ
jgi:hypothetical protein